MNPVDHYRRDAILPDEVTMKREDVRPFRPAVWSEKSIPPRDGDSLDDAQSAAMDALKECIVILVMLIIVGSACWFFGLRQYYQMEAEIATPAVEIDFDAPPVPDFDAAWDGIPVPPFRSDSK